MSWPPTAIPPLLPAHVHVWSISLAVDASALAPLEHLLSSDERQRADRFAFPELRQRFVVTRASLRRLLGHYTRRPVEEIRFTYGPAGKPSLVGGGCHFNVSHSGTHALIAVAIQPPAGPPGAGELGVDLELIRPLDCDAIARRVLPEADQLALAHAAPSAKSDTFFRLWVRHEAQLKARGMGLGTRVDDLPVYDLDVGPAYRAALATDTSNIHIERFYE